MPGVRVQVPAPPRSGKQSIQSLGGEAAGCWEGEGVLAGNRLGKWAGVNAVGVPPGRMEGEDRT